MPYAQLHYPFENQSVFNAGFPAEFIAEGLDQTRGWFYTLTVLSAALFKKPAFRNVIVNGMVMAEDGRKMSKRLRNYTPPDESDGDVRRRCAAAVSDQLGSGARRGTAFRRHRRQRHDAPHAVAVVSRVPVPDDVRDDRSLVARQGPALRQQHPRPVDPVAAADARKGHRPGDAQVPALQRRAAPARVHRRADQRLHPAESRPVLGQGHHGRQDRGVQHAVYRDRRADDGDGAVHAVSGRASVSGTREADGSRRAEAAVGASVFVSGSRRSR